MMLRLIDRDFPDDTEMNLALDEAVFDEVSAGRSPPTFRFYRNSNAVILGRFQLAEEEVDLDYARANKVKIAKRFTGGGAVYHDMGNLNYSVIANDSFDIGMDVTKLFSTMIDGAMVAFSDMGLDPKSGKLNDVSVNGKKILGAAATLGKGTLLFHAATLVDVDLMRLATVLKVPGVKLKDKGVSTILERVTNIKALTGKGQDDVKNALLGGYAKSLGFEYEKGDFTRRELDSAEKLLKDRYRQADWNMGRRIV